jgi:hypothetical protein
MPCALDDGFRNPVEEPVDTAPPVVPSASTPTWQQTWSWQHNLPPVMNSQQQESQPQPQPQSQPQPQPPVIPPNAENQFKSVLQCGGVDGCTGDCNAAILSILSCGNCREKTKANACPHGESGVLGTKRISEWANRNPFLFLGGLLIILIILNSVLNSRRTARRFF